MEMKKQKKNEENLLWISSCMCGIAENEMLTRRATREWDESKRKEEERSETRFLLDKRWRLRIPFQEM